MPTPAELQAQQDASAAWLVENRPDLISYTQPTAEAAAAYNAAYLSNQLPVLAAVAPTAANTDYSNYSQQQREAVYNQGGSSLVLTWEGGSSEVQGKAVYLTEAEYQAKYGMSDAEYESQKYNIFNNPMAVDPSKLPGNLLETYGQQMQQNTHEYFMRNPSPEFLRITEQYGLQQNRVIGDFGVMWQGAPAKSLTNPFGSNNALAIAWEVGQTGGATDYRMNLIAEAEGRQLGVDTSFIRYASDIYQERPSFAREVLTTRTGQQFTNKEWTGVPIRLNLTMDEIVAGGGITKENYGKFLQYDDTTHLLNRITSPGISIGVDPGVHKEFGDFGGPILKNGSYGGWTPGGRLIGGKTLASQAMITSGGLPAPFISTSTPAKQRTIFDELGSWYAGAESTASKVMGFDKIPTPTTEQIKKTAPFFLGPGSILGLQPIGTALQTPVASDYMASYLKGEYEGIRTRPLTAGLFFGMGAVIGGGFRGLEAGVAAGRAAAAEKIISSGGMWRAADITSAGAMKYGPKLLAGLYAADVGIRTTALGSDFSPMAAERFGGIMATEARPMTIGGIFGYAAPGVAYKAAKLSDIGFKSAMQEGTTTGRADYYLKQPVSKPYELAKIEYKSYLQENQGATFPDYLSYRVQRPVAHMQARVDVTLEKFFHPSRFAGVETTENIWQPRSSLNIWGRERGPSPTKFSIGGNEPPKPSGFVEVKSSGGMVQLARMEQRPMFEQLPRVETDMRGMPVHPRGPEPFIRGRYRIEDQEEYYRLPPGMVSPGPKRATVQEISFLPSSMMGFTTTTMQENFIGQGLFNTVRQDFQQLSRLETGQAAKSDVFSMSRQDTMQVPRREIGLSMIPGITPISLSGTVQIPFQDTGTGVVQVPFLDTRTRQDSIFRQDQRIVPDQARWQRTLTPENPRPIFGGGAWPPGGGGSRQQGGLGVRTWFRNNLLPTASYLSKGMRDPFSGAPMTRWLGGKKGKRRKGPFG